MRGVYLVTDSSLIGERPLERVVEQAVQNGVSFVQLREKEASTREFLEKATRLKEILAPYQIPLLINDRVDIALAAEAHGVHLGQSDMPPHLARKILGEKALIGLSVETWADVLEAQHLPVDYLAVSPVFSTPTKTDTKDPWGLEGVRRIREATRLPLVGIGGLNSSNARDAVLAGVDCIAVVSAICAAADPALASRELVEIVENALTERS